MKDRERFDQDLHGWLREAAPRRAPDYLVPMAMAAVHGTRQRPTAVFSHPAPWFALAGVATVAMVILAVAALAPPVTPPPVGSPPPVGLASVSPSPRPSAPAHTPTPLDLPSFTAGQVADATTAWTGLSWHRLANDVPLASVRKVVRRDGAGYVAIGSYDTERDGTVIWTSMDGAHFQPTAFIASAMVLDIAELEGLWVAIVAAPSRLDCPGLAACVGTLESVRALISVDGINWHQGSLPDLAATGPINREPVVAVGPAGILIGRSGGPAVAALSSDGTNSSLVSGGFPQGFELAGIWGRQDGYAAIGTITSGTAENPGFTATTLWSADGRDWSVTSEPEVSRADFVRDASKQGPMTSFVSLTTGRDGAIAVGHEGGTPGITSWWHSTDGRSWRNVADFAPLGPARREDGSSFGVPDGRLASDGSRILALRLDDKPAVWTSFDGTTWTPLALQDAPQDGDVLVLPSGLLLVDGQSTWFGEASHE